MTLNLRSSGALLRNRLGRAKWSATRRMKYGNIVLIFAEYPDLFKVITITKGRKSA